MESESDDADSDIGSSASQSAKQDGWTIPDICALMLYTVKSNGVTNSTLDKFLKIVALVINGERNMEDGLSGKKFPANVRSVKRMLEISHEDQWKVVHIMSHKTDCTEERPRRSYNRDMWLHTT
ncbi:hypothetical protein RvY_16925 [Ramazzottius varieornatus]|uniref:Uncharacterized protein n=1 Tax=Ramazzottius varieornatus TaxID=947166 RepID=A0A1D1W091_RAMVA|nr:hypothetical protein RvY_16925 [Ramazzottius varieornatus]